MVQRIGLVPNIDAQGVEHLHRASLIVTREVNPLGERYGRAPTVSLAVPVGVFRMSAVAAVVIFGSDEKLVAQAMLSVRAANMVVVLKTKPRKNSPIHVVTERLGEQHKVTVYVISAKAKVRAIDVGAGRTIDSVSNLQRPPQTQSAPSIPARLRRPGPKPRAPAPSVPKK